MPVNSLTELVDGELANAEPLNENFETLRVAVNAVETLANANNDRILTNNPQYIESDAGNLQLNALTNSFVAGGDEDITAISGWTKGIAIIRWATSRTITHNSTTLILQNSRDRKIEAGDINFFEFTADGARELLYFPKEDKSDTIILDDSATDTFTLEENSVQHLSPTQADTINLPSELEADCIRCLLKIFNGSTVYTMTLPSGVKWKERAEPDLTEASANYTLLFWTTDKGVNWEGTCVPEGSSS